MKDQAPDRISKASLTSDISHARPFTKPPPTAQPRASAPYLFANRTTWKSDLANPALPHCSGNGAFFHIRRLA
jgi:hypothetical protein